MKPSLRTILAAFIATMAILLISPNPASASTFNDRYSGSDAITRTTTLNFAGAHGNFNLRIWVTTSCCFVSNKYSIRMYNNAGSQLWTASNQADRTYVVGGNVTKIVLIRNATQGATTNWQKR